MASSWKVIPVRIQRPAEYIYPESKCGVRVDRSSVSMILSLSQVYEKFREQLKLLYIAFIDIAKAFDLISRAGLFRILMNIERHQIYWTWKIISWAHDVMNPLRRQYIWKPQHSQRRTTLICSLMHLLSHILFRSLQKDELLVPYRRSYSSKFAR